MPAFLPILTAVVIIVLAGALRIHHHRRRFGSSPFVVFQSTSWRDGLPELALGLFAFVLIAEAIAWAFFPRVAESYVIVPPLVRTGLAVITVGLAIVLRAQNDLGASWRIGIEHAARPGLITQGLYRYSRNPIFLGVFVIVAGFVVLMPTALSVLLLFGIVVAARVQVRREERYLTEAYGSEFRSYAQHVGRFLP